MIGAVVAVFLFIGAISTAIASKTVIPFIQELNFNRNLILASASPRRRELLALMGLGNFNIKISNFAEDLDKNQFITAEQYCLTTAIKKGEDVIASNFQPFQYGTVIISADTIVECNGNIFEKPADEKDAIRMLSALSGSFHKVHTGVAIFANGITNISPQAPKLVYSFTETTQVNFVELDEDDIRGYIGTQEPMDKAGAYGIQGIGGQLVDSIKGCYFNVMGLPIKALSLSMAELYKAGKL